MNDLFIAATAHTAEVDFRFSQHRLALSGEAFPEDANAYFHPILTALAAYLEATDDTNIAFDFRLTYFNSASTRMLYSLFELLNQSACTRNRIALNWYHDAEDDTILDFGLNVQEDFPALDFQAVAVDLAPA